MDGLGVILFFGLLIGVGFGFGAAVGSDMTNAAWKSDCTNLGMTVTNKVVYQCSVKEK